MLKTWVSFLVGVFLFSTVHCEEPLATSILETVDFTENDIEKNIISEIMVRIRMRKNNFFIRVASTQPESDYLEEWFLDHSWAGVILERNADSYAEHFETITNYKRLIYLNCHITGFRSHEGETITLDEFLEVFSSTVQISYLSLQGEGEEYYVLGSLLKTPNIICVEVNPYWHPKFEKEIPYKSAVLEKLGQPYRKMFSMAETVGYIPVCYFKGKLYLVNREYKYYFKKCNLTSDFLWDEGWRYLTKGEQEEFHESRRQNSRLATFEGELADSPVYEGTKFRIVEGAEDSDEPTILPVEEEETELQVEVFKEESEQADEAQEEIEPEVEELEEETELQVEVFKEESEQAGEAQEEIEPEVEELEEVIEGPVEV